MITPGALRRLGCVLLLSLVWVVGTSHVCFATPSEGQVLTGPTVLVNVTVSTFKTRGRVFYDVEASIIKKLHSSGLQTVRDAQRPHDYQLKVHYEEQRGEEFDIGRWGTTIDGTFEFRKKQGDILWDWRVHEVSTNDISGAPPYIDALLKFATHPNYFFLGPILKELTRPDGSIPNALTHALLRRLTEAYPLKGEEDPEAADYQQDHFMEAIHVVHQDVAFQRTFDELLEEQVDKKAMVSIAERFIQSSDPQLRIRGVAVLGQSQSHPETLRRLAQNDPNQEVRKTAQEFSHP